jgi:hypothetical protein
MGIKLILDTINARLDALETTALGRARRRLSKSELAKAEGVTTRTIDRRVENGTLPPSDDVISGRHFWWSDTIERHHRKRGKADTAAARAARNPRLRKPAHTSPET